MAKPAIELKDIACTFVSDDSGVTSVYTAVKGVNLTVADGEFVSVVGPTGCGKSTLLNMSVHVSGRQSDALEKCIGQCGGRFGV